MQMKAVRHNSAEGIKITTFQDIFVEQMSFTK